MGKEQRPVMTTTLYDLISTLHTQVGVEDDQMIIAIVTYLLRTRQIRYIETSPPDHDRTGHHPDWHLHDACVVSAVQSSSPRTPPVGAKERASWASWHISMKQRRTVSCAILVNHLVVPLPG